MSIPVSSDPSKKSWPQKILDKCKEQPFVPLGAGATVAALLGASYHLRKGNRTRFNQFLRFRIYAQGVTVVALLIYGSQELAAREKAGVVKRKDDRIVVYPQTSPFPAAPEPIMRSDEPSALPESLSSAVDVKSKPSDAYPLRKEERMKVSEFAKRLKEAEALQKEEDASRRR
ncbi:hypothetical protein J008_01784 [Cryptococcus neoformans]|uniref:HIG1 domain-containing protein n=2 Tax=Cryptococcus neoformans TaxID=5207 RepID=A0A854QF32_CRYNE|nr:hypothetical protein CNAG_02783 [Cryptococcus neoformans var. grubii H99]AUB23499.1 hypothetical protein CKF44_02783 [Cryptococcus neoformans var. grubii]OWT41102.1 hypothetical protein C362_01316 [Cryptococcus neoformans var. grubii Bt1]OWZ34484.1 hypothetical protein C347_01868 [Cryptococcus neoformans var. grubii AD2-60a]OWZ46568.1 hypothetical protein C343_01799 [Cryptococcus neoformans var. grubii C23]OWZ54505.1 hypothetical protein C356_01804 [Cryptococcus neoformans var. grubii c45]|eukprot:XP_012048130.1 hypothetical protein CNAG_02783 [Cryptococcus neoformans var. grubii H99]